MFLRIHLEFLHCHQQYYLLPHIHLDHLSWTGDYLMNHLMISFETHLNVMSLLTTILAFGKLGWTLCRLARVASTSEASFWLELECFLNDFVLLLENVPFFSKSCWGFLKNVDFFLLLTVCSSVVPSLFVMAFICALVLSSTLASS